MKDHAWLVFWLCVVVALPHAFAHASESEEDTTKATSYAQEELLAGGGERSAESYQYYQLVAVQEEPRGRTFHDE